MRNFLISLEIRENIIATLSLTSFTGIEYGNIKNFSYQCLIPQKIYADLLPSNIIFNTLHEWTTKTIVQIF